MTRLARAELQKAFAHHDELVRRCVEGDLAFEAFVAEYDNFYDRYALDGHEGGGELPGDHGAVDFHRKVRDEVLYPVCSGTDAKLDEYRSAGRIGPGEAVARLAKLVAESARFAR
jgi:hypothetical protein